MSWSLAIANGDLTLGGQGLNTVSGTSKLVQDLRCALLTPTGTDPLHPTFGSVIDGGMDVQGNYHVGIIGQENDPGAEAFIIAEIQRVCRAYQSQQVARNHADIATYGRSTLTADEALLSIGDIKAQRITDQVLVTVVLQTGVQTIAFNLPFETS